ncbi:riboflavin synthase, alpha subunit [Melioribacter roseus P3M-2]|uniref:Riboflavin synthase n=1 Tax=Melioribacter roseus (strain DSM 23840 / JCM 17771 / VKM B-2668 / P3M-2) TaxID=1191523 RepID=I7A5M1_MELRP|nr:riboflavin synthase [Melioribacter roseus]AFN75196.1 riboflavin synthase, alpha subunit [Melioribacter roseus P3M-2]
MFSGIVEEIGKIERVDRIENGIQFSISGKNIFEDLKLGDSVAVDGVCLTVTSINNNLFNVDAVGETLLKTTLRNYNAGNFVNLERAIKYNERIGGHLVQGHVNYTGKIRGIIPKGENYLLEISYPYQLKKYFIDEGSIAVNGVSLTIARLYEEYLVISVIPYTWEHTTLKFKKPGDLVNIEVDLIAKYVEKLINSKEDSNFTTDKLKKMGY